MKLLLRTPLFAGVLAGVALGGLAAGWALGHRPSSDAVHAFEDCTLTPDAPATLLLPSGPFVSHDSTTDDVPTGTEGRSSAYQTCRSSTPGASVTVLTRTVTGGTPAQRLGRFAAVHHLRVKDGVRAASPRGTLVWPTAAFGEFACRRHDDRKYDVEVHLTGAAGRGTPHRSTVLGDVVAQAAGKSLGDCL